MKGLLTDEAHTRRFAEVLAQSMAVPLCVYLSGDLGTGKTTLVRFILAALGYTGLVKSPTYGLVENYALPELTVCHADLYRLGHPDELEMLDVRDWLREQTLLLVEWPQRGAGFLPPADITVMLSHRGGDLRGVEIVPESAAGEPVVSRFPANLFD